MKNDIIHMNIGKGDKLVVTPLPGARLKVTGKTTKTIEGVEFKMKKIWTEDQLVEINEIKNGISNNTKGIERNAQAIERNAQAIKKLDSRVANLEVGMNKLLTHFNIA